MKKLLSLLLALSMVLALVACGGGGNDDANKGNENDNQQNEQQNNTDDNKEPEAPPAESRPNRIVFGTSTQMNGDVSHKWFSNNSTDYLLTDLTEDYKIIVNDQDDAHVINPTVCDGVEYVLNDDGTATHTVKIKQGLQFSNGEPITAANYVGYALVMFSPAAREANASQVIAASLIGSAEYQAGDVPYISGLHLIDEYTYEVNIDAEYAEGYYAYDECSLQPLYLPMMCSSPLTVKDDGEGAYLEGGENLNADEIGATRWIAGEARVSAGPYTLDEIDPSSYSAVLTRNPYYAGNFEGQKPSIETIVVVYAPKETQFDSLTTGGIDLLNQLGEGADIDRALDLVEEGGYDYCAFDRCGYGHIMFACDGGPTQFTAVRQAVVYLLDRAEFANAFTGGHGSLVHGPYGLAMWMYQDSAEYLAENLNTYSYNPAEAVRLLEEDGWTLNADGTPYSGSGLRYKEVTAEQAKGYEDLNVTLSDGRILMPLQIRWASSENNSVSDMLATMLANGTQVADAGMVINQDTMAFSDLMNWKGRKKEIDPRYGSFYYGMYNMATNWTGGYDRSYSFTLDPKYVEMGYNENYLFDEELDRLGYNMIYDVQPGDDAKYLDYWQQFIVRHNELVPLMPLYSNIYHTIYRDWLKDYNQTSLWDFQEAILYAHIEGAE